MYLRWQFKNVSTILLSLFSLHLWANSPEDISKHVCFEKFQAYAHKQKWFPVWQQLSDQSMLWSKDQQTDIYLKYSKNNLTLIQVHNQNKLVMNWSAELKCQAQTQLASNPVSATGGFRNKELNELLTQQQNGLIYIWSPHMSLSVPGIIEAEKVAKELNLPLKVLMDPLAELANAKSALQKMKLEASTYLTIQNSTQLFAKGANIHYPMLLMYKQGALVRQLIPGFETQEIYSKLIKGFMR